MEHIEELWPGGFRLITDDRHFKLSTDSALLASYPGLIKGCRICDLGCGIGVLPVLLSARNTQLHIDAVDIQSSALALAARNITLNGLTNSVSLFEGDIRNLSGLFPEGSYDLVIANPPYFSKGSGFTVAADTVGTARDDRVCTIEDVCAAAYHLTRWGGRFAVVFRPERLVDLFWALRSHGLEPKRLRMVRHRLNSPPSIVLVESRRGGKPGLIIEPPLILHNPDGSETEETKAIYRR